MKENIYDCIIVGTGPAGYTASIYLSRYKISNLLIGKQPGGTITLAHKVENFPGFTAISGVELGQKMAEQVKGLGATIETEEVARIERVDQLIKLIEGGGGESITSIISTTGTTSKDETARFKVTTENNKEYYAKSIIVATGTERRKLGVPGETDFVGRGVSYCTNCDAPFFRDKTVAVVGGSDAAVSGAVHLTGFADKIYLIYRGERLRPEPVWIDQVVGNPKVEVVYGINITKIREGLGGSGELGGLGKVGAVELDREYKGNKILSVDGVFIEIGGVPASSFLKPLGVEVDQSGFVVVNDKMETNVAGVFAAGDNTIHSLIMAQAITACAQGAVAAGGVFKFLHGGQKAPQQLGV